MNEKAENTRLMLIVQMKRVIELLEDEKFSEYSSLFSEYDRKMHEVRRDSIRFGKELKPWTK